MRIAGEWELLQLGDRGRAQRFGYEPPRHKPPEGVGNLEIDNVRNVHLLSGAESLPHDLGSRSSPGQRLNED